MQDNERNILEQYDIDIRSTRKTRGAVLCDTEQGIFLLKEIKASEERINSLGELYESLGNLMWCKVDSIVRNGEGKYISVLENGNKYILKRWFHARECDVRKPGELIEGAGMLAKIHVQMQSELKNPIPKAEKLLQEYEKHNRELKKVRCFIRKNSPKREFEYEFLGDFENMYQWAECAERLLISSGYEKLYEESIQKSCMTHGEYNYHNILMEDVKTSEKIVAITNFEKFKRDIQVEDFYYYLRKVMEKYGWKERLGDSLINAYSAVKPLSENEIEYIKIRLIYPEKFWKVANSFYNSNKAWISSKNLEKLEIAIRQTREKERFLHNVFSFTI